MDFNDTILVSRTPRFLGIETDDWEGWISRFESLTLGQNDEERIKRLLPLLDGVALDCARSQFQIDKAYDQLKACLSTRFGRTVDPLQAQAELGRAVQLPGESAANFADRIEKLGRASFPDMVAALSKTKTGKVTGGTDGKDQVAEKNDYAFFMKTLTSRFICGLSDEWLQTKLCHKRPESLADAVSMINELHKRQEVVQAVRLGNGGAGRVRPGGAPEAAAVRQAERLGLRSAAALNQAEIEGGDNARRDVQIAELEREVSNLRASLEAVTVANADSDSSRRAACYKCGSPGHFRRDCPAARRSQARSRATRMTCYSCGEEGHLRNSCPFAARAGAAPRPVCLCCGQSGHWMAECHALSGQMRHAIEGGHGVTPRQTAARTGQAEN